jgi:hypothetical protein
MNFISIYESNDSFELNIIKIELKRENINFRILNENTLQIGNVYALGNNGAIVQVQEAFLEQAELVLTNLNLISVHNQENDKFYIVKYFEEITSSIPILKRMNTSTRLICVIVFLISMPLILLGISSMKNTSEKLVMNKWCLDEIIYKSDTLMPNTLDYIKITGLGCNERIEFKENKGIFLPGFQNNKSQGQWKISEDGSKIIMFNMFNNKEIYEGKYIFKLFTNGRLELESENTKMKLSPWKMF